MPLQFAPLYPWLYKLLQPTFPDCLWQGNQPRTLALTIDDGPHPDHTPRLLEVLEQYDIKASFFWLGVCVDRFPHIAQRVWQQGHWIGLHGYDHQSFPRLSSAALQDSLIRTQAAIAQACGLDLADVQQQIRDVRPPNGLFTPKTLQDLQQWQYRPVMWTVVPEDWVNPGVEVVVRRVMEQSRDGALIVLHDGYHGGNDVGAIAAQIIPRLLQQGYQFVTIDDLWQQRLAAA